MEYNRTTVQEVRGMLFDGNVIYDKTLVVRITSDKYGKTLSIADEEENVMLMVPMEPIAKRLKEVLYEGDAKLR